jgi:hypothetical protein
LRLRGFEGSGLQITAHSRLLDFVSSRLQIFASSLPLKSCITNFINLDVSRVTGFSEFPNTSPSGKRVDSDDLIPRTFRNFSKKRHPPNVGGDTRHPETSQWSNQGTFAELPPPPLAPINRRLSLLKFSLLPCFVANCNSLLRGNSSCVSSVRGFKFSPNFSKVLFSLSLNSCLFFTLY